jgi:hypothetical protein
MQLRRGECMKGYFCGLLSFVTAAQREAGNSAVYRRSRLRGNDDHLFFEIGFMQSP